MQFVVSSEKFAKTVPASSTLAPLLLPPILLLRSPAVTARVARVELQGFHCVCLVWFIDFYRHSRRLT